VLVTVLSPGGARATTRVPADARVADLAPGLGLAVAVANVTDLDDPSGRRLPPRSTLADAGLGPEATVVVVPPGLAPPPGAAAAAATARPAGGAHPAATARPAAGEPAPPPPATPPTAERRVGPVLAGGVLLAVVAVVAFLLGGVALGGASTATGPGRAAEDAARAWLRAAPFPGKRAAALPRDLDRRGALPGATLQPLGQWHHGSQAGELFAVTVGSSTFGLVVATDHGALTAPPTPTPLPPVVGQAPPAPPARLSATAATPPDPVRRWAAATFGPKGSGLAALGLGLGGTPSAVGSWSPAAGGVAYRVRVPLSSLAPGTAGGQAAAAYQALAQRLAADTAANGTAQAAARQAQAAAQAATAAATAANPPNPALTAQAAAATTAATVALQQAQGTASAVAADQSSLAAAPRPAAGAVTAVATYDVWMRARSVVGWEPAGYRAPG
jgi:hypothetical protein